MPFARTLAFRHFDVFRGGPDDEGAFVQFSVPVEEGMVVLDALHWIQANEAPSCGALELQGGEVRLLQRRGERHAVAHLQDAHHRPPLGPADQGGADADLPADQGLVTDVSWNYEVNSRIQPFTPPADAPEEAWRWQQQDIERVQEFRKCIECFLCQDVCHVLRNHETKNPFLGPRYLVRVAGLELHPMDRADRRRYLKDEGNIGYCNITKCCTEVCPEHIKITDNAIIPLKERVVDASYDPLAAAWRAIAGTGRRSSEAKKPAAPRTATAKVEEGQETATAEPLRRRVRAPSPYRFPDAESAFVAWSYAQALLTDAGTSGWPPWTRDSGRT